MFSLLQCMDRTPPPSQLRSQFWSLLTLPAYTRQPAPVRRDPAATRICLLVSTSAYILGLVFRNISESVVVELGHAVRESCLDWLQAKFHGINHSQSSQQGQLQVDVPELQHCGQDTCIPFKVDNSISTANPPRSFSWFLSVLVAVIFLEPIFATAATRSWWVFMGVRSRSRSRPLQGG